MRIVVPFGFYGWGNIGDEATLQGFARLVDGSGRRLHVWVGSRNPRHTSQVEPSFRYFWARGRDWKRRLAKIFASAVVVAGGTPIMDCLGKWPLCEVTPLVEEAHHRGRPVAFIGIGTERLARDESRRIVCERLSPCLRHWSVRSPRDQSRLIEYGVPPERISVAADMAWLLEPVSPQWGRRRIDDWGLGEHRRLLGVNLVAEKAVLEREPQLFAKMAEGLDALVEKNGVFVLFLANEVRSGETYDTAAAHRTLALMKHASHAFIAPNEYIAPQQMLSLISNCHATMSMRYHFCLFSALQSVPFVALKRSDKIVDLCSDLEWPFDAELSGFRTDCLFESFWEMERWRATVVTKLSMNVAALRQRAICNLAALEALRVGDWEHASRKRQIVERL